MLQFIREKATGWIAWFIIVLICVPFALWGIQEYVSPQGSLAVAEVNDTEIGYYQFQNAFQNQRRQLERMLGQRITSVDMERRLRDETLNRLIEDEVLVQTALSEGLRVGDGQLAEAIRELPAFRGERGFTQEIYDGFLRTQGLAAQGFEFDMRRSLLGEQIVSAVQRSELVTRAEVQRLWKQRNETRRFRRMLIDPSKLEVPTPDEEAVARYFEDHKDQYNRPQKVKLAYIEVARDDIAERVPVEEQELRAIYDGTRQNYRTDEQREARHILVQVARDAEDTEVEAARKKIQALRERIRQGEDFAAVAREASDDPGSAANGGSLGFFGRGVMDPAFEEAAFSLGENELGEPVKSSFGWHLIQVTGIQPEKVRSFEEVRSTIEADYRNAEAEQVYAGKVDELANLSFENPASLDAAAQALAVPVQNSEFFARDAVDAPGIAASAAVREAAFSVEVLEEGNNSELLQLGPGRVAVVRLLERQEARPLTLDEAREQVRATLLAEARARKASAMGAEIVAAIKAGGKLEDVATQHGQRFEPAAEASPAKPGSLDQQVQRALFTMPAPASGDVPVVEGLAVDGAGYQVLALLEVKPAEAGPDETQRRSTVAALSSALGTEAFNAVMGGLRQRAAVRVFEDALSSDLP